MGRDLAEPKLLRGLLLLAGEKALDISMEETGTLRHDSVSTGCGPSGDRSDSCKNPRGAIFANFRHLDTVHFDQFF